MITPEYKRDVNNYYLVLQALDMQNIYDHEMLQHNAVYGLVPLSVQTKNGLTSFYYNIGNRQSVDKAFEVKDMDYRDVKNILVSISLLLNRIKEYLLNENSIVLQPDLIYTDLSKINFHYIYYPGANLVFLEEFKKLTEFFLSKVNYKDDRAVELVYSIFKEARNENFTFKIVMDHFREEDIYETDRHEDVVKEDSASFGEELFYEEDILQDSNNQTEEVVPVERMSSPREMRKRRFTKFFGIIGGLLIMLISLIGVIFFKNCTPGYRDYMLMSVGITIIGITLLNRK